MLDRWRADDSQLECVGYRLPLSKRVRGVLSEKLQITADHNQNFLLQVISRQSLTSISVARFAGFGLFLGVVPGLRSLRSLTRG